MIKPKLSVLLTILWFPCIQGSAQANLDCAPTDTLCQEVRNNIFTRNWGYSLGRLDFKISAALSSYSPVLGPTEVTIVDDRGTPNTSDDLLVQGTYLFTRDNQQRIHYARLDTSKTLPADAYGRTTHQMYSCDSYVTDPNACGFNVQNDFFSGFTNMAVNASVTPAANVQKRNIYYRSYLPPLSGSSRPILLALTQTFQYETIASPLTGDFNNDGAVGLKDLIILRNQIGGPGSADLSGNGIVGTEDLALFVTHFGKTGTGTSKLKVTIHTQTTAIPGSNGHYTDFGTRQRVQYALDEVQIDNVLISKSGTVSTYSLDNGALLGTYSVVWNVDINGNITGTQVTRSGGGTFNYTGNVDPEDIHNRVSQPAAAPGALVQAVAKRAVDVEAKQTKDPRIVPVMAEKINGEDRRAKPTGD